MVSNTSLLKYGGLGIAAVVAYLALGGSKGIGSGIGSGISGFFNSLFGGIGQIQFPSLFNSGDGSGITQEQRDLIASHGIKTVDGINTENDRIVQAGGIPRGSNAPIFALAFKEDLENKNVSPEFASRFSFAPPVKKGLDVSNTFKFISETDGNPVNVTASSTNTTKFGGFKSENDRRTTLTQLIERNSQLYPEFFG